MVPMFGARAGVNVALGLEDATRGLSQMRRDQRHERAREVHSITRTEV